jgi:hypothetical protein
LLRNSFRDYSPKCEILSPSGRSVLLALREVALGQLKVIRHGVGSTPKLGFGLATLNAIEARYDYDLPIVFCAAR